LRACPGKQVARQPGPQYDRLLGTLCLVFCAEAEDKSAFVLLANGGPKDREETMAAMVGYMPTVAIAVVSGFILERQLADHRLNSLVLAFFCAVALVSLSQSLLHSSSLQTGDASQTQHTPGSSSREG